MSGPTPTHLERLNPEQYDAVTHTAGPLLILAGAGSGKTRVLTRRIAHLLHTGVAPENILAVTFTNKAAAEMKERVAELVGEAGRKVWVSTFHSSCCRILRMEAEALGYTARFAIYDDDDQHRIVSQILHDLGYDWKVVPVGAILGKIDHYKNRMMTVEQVVAEHRHHPDIALVRVWRAYEEALRAADAVDFNDLIGKAVELFDTRPDVLQKYRERFHYVLVDEYQDTNRAQYRLLRMLTSEHRNIAVVGDDDQSIYAFRGADISNILNFEKDFPEAKVVRMEQNYRSTENILAVANAVVSKNEDRIAKRLWTSTTGGPRVSFLVAEDPRAEARLVAQAVHQLRRKGTLFSEVAVIYRTNAVSQPFEAAFRELSIPYHVVGGRQFYSRREIRDALSYLRLIGNPADDAAFLRVVNVPLRGIGAGTLTKLREEAATRGEPLLKAARGFGKGADRAARAVGGFVQVVDGLTELSRSASLPILVQQTLERSGYLAMLETEDSNEARGRLDNLRQLLRDAASFEPPTPDAPPDERLSAWLDRIALAGADEDVPEGGQVTLMTVHTSKGLEYPVVFVAQVIEGQFPHSRSAEEPGGVEEERRLAYVAFTRAQKRLLISRSRHLLAFDPTTGKTSTQPAAPSRFLFGIPIEACDGDVPMIEPEVDPRAARMKPRPPDQDAKDKLRALREHIARGPVLPAGDYVTLEIESEEQLTRGARVLHDQHGVGEVLYRSGATLGVRFAGGIRRVGLGDGHLHILRDG
ncbi:MAG TPA: UvrD-helicase domain-containing protein [Myxococcota bacterium]|nr:UvrD-helicase domain-containing protein [Myxococcota bacterium]